MLLPCEASRRPPFSLAPGISNGVAHFTFLYQPFFYHEAPAAKLFPLPSFLLFIFLLLLATRGFSCFDQSRVPLTGPSHTKSPSPESRA